MSQSVNNPAINPANNDNLAGLLQHTFNKFMQKMDGMLPAVVIACDRTKIPVRANVKPQIALLGTSGEVIPRAEIASVPVFELGAGGFLLSFNYKPGDFGWIIAADRDISNFLNTMQVSKPNTLRIHDFSDSVFFPHQMLPYVLADEDIANAVFQNLDGTVKLSLGDIQLNLTAPTIKLTGTVDIEGDLNVSGRLIVQGQINSGNNITAVGDITPGTPIPP